MLYGVRPAEQERLAGRGARMRVHVPYGPGWYPYVMRRLTEHPRNLVIFAHSLLTRH
jgi:proline dehydrogenase